MQKAIIDLMPNLLEDATGTCIVSYNNIEVSNLEYVNKRLQKKDLQSIKNIISNLEAHSRGFANALWNLAVCYDCGICTDVDADKAKEYYMLAYMQILLDKGQLKFNEKNITVVNLVDCAQAYEEAAKLEYVCAMFFLGLAYLNGLGVPENDVEANRWFQKASNKGLNMATNVLACSYLHGYGVPKDVDKAISLLRTSVSNGDVEGLFVLASIVYNNGNKAEGIKLLKKAACRGHKKAIEFLMKLGY